MSTKAVGDLQGGRRGDGWSAHSFLSHSEVAFRPKSSNPNLSRKRQHESLLSRHPRFRGWKRHSTQSWRPCQAVDGAVLRLPQLPGTRQVICLCLSLSSPITLRHLGHDEKHWLDSPLCSWTCCISPCWVADALTPLCNFGCSALTLPATRQSGNESRQRQFLQADQGKVFEIQHNSTFRCLGSPTWLDSALNHFEV